MIKLIVTDVDETLVPEGTYDINPEYYDVIRQLTEKGILFAAASGRHDSGVRKLMKPVEDTVFALSANGTCVTRRGEMLAYWEIAQDLFLKVLEKMRMYHPDIILADRPECVYTDTSDEEMFRWIHDGYRVDVRKCPDLAHLVSPILKTAMWVNEDAALYVDRMREQFVNELNIMTAGDHWVDIVAREADKATAVAAIQERYGILPEETIAFGDNGNDIGMLKLAGHSYAVENARDEVKSAADEVIGPMREDAVLKVLKGLL